MTRRSCRRAERATDREVGVVAAVLASGSEKAAAHRLGLSHSTVKHHLANARSKVGAETTAQLVWILGPWLPPPERPPTFRSRCGWRSRPGRSTGSAAHGPAAVAHCRSCHRSRAPGYASSVPNRPVPETEAA